MSQPRVTSGPGRGQFAEDPKSSPEVALPERLAGELTVTKRSKDAADESWPPPPSVTVSRVTGKLSDRIRARLGAEDAEVTLAEETCYGGYSVWTQDNSTTFEVTAGERTVTFHPDSSGISWGETHRSDSVFARFDAWLQVAERPDELFQEWFGDEPDEDCKWWQSWEAKPDTVLWNAAKPLAGRRFERIQLHRMPWDWYRHQERTLDGTDQRQWSLRFIAAPDERDFREIVHQVHLYDILDIKDVEAPTHRQLLENITDEVMLGRERW